MENMINAGLVYLGFVTFCILSVKLKIRIDKQLNSIIEYLEDIKKDIDKIKNK